MNKKAEMEIRTIVVIVLTLLVLIAVAMFFTGGYKSLTNKFAGFSGGALNSTKSTGSVVGGFLQNGTW